MGLLDRLSGGKKGAKKVDKKKGKGKPAPAEDAAAATEEVDFTPAPEKPKQKAAAKPGDSAKKWEKRREIASTYRSAIDKIAAQVDLSDPNVRSKVREHVRLKVYNPMVQTFGIDNELRQELLMDRILDYLNLKIELASAGKKPRKKSAPAPAAKAPAAAASTEVAASAESEPALDELDADLAAEAARTPAPSDAGSGDAIADVLGLSDEAASDDIGLGTEELDGEGTADLTEDAAAASSAADSDLVVQSDGDDEEELTLADDPDEKG